VAAVVEVVAGEVVVAVERPFRSAVPLSPRRPVADP
jgi:hypothetical protein